MHESSSPGKNRKKTRLLYLFLFLALIILIVAFPKRRPLRDMLPPLTYFHRFFERNAFYLSRSLASDKGRSTQLYDTLCKDLHAGGRRLEEILNAAFEAEAYLTPMVNAYMQEIGAAKAHDAHDTDWTGSQAPASAGEYFASPKPVRYRGDSPGEIQDCSARAWQNFPPDFKTLLCDLFTHASPAAARFRAVRHTLFQRGYTVPDPNDTNEMSSWISKGMKKADARDLIQVWPALLPYCESLDRALKVISEEAPYITSPEIPGSSWFPEGILYAAGTPFGMVLVGGEGDNLYPAGDVFLVIDLGGNDTYFFDECFLSREHGGGTSPCSTVLDLGGNDFYTGGMGCMAGGYLGYRTILDLEGDDLYTSKGIGIGAGFMGMGLLVDVKGHDRYTAGLFSQGAGFYGLGLLIDGRGDDIYKATGMCQGYAGAMGLGCLVDQSGSDLYISLPDEEDRNPRSGRDRKGISLAQGVFAGPQGSDEPGGLGMLLDLTGDDSYRSGSESQGAAMGRGLGLLLDGRGYDFYNSQDRSQGYGGSGGIGILRDTLGNDNYLARDFVQGMGDAGSLGMLIDDAGNDQYYAFDSAQGMNRDDGTGMLCDIKGRNQFSANRTISLKE
ncbi:MAG: hypothetical protein ACYTG7_13485 [Planctomycetota bacterium]